MTGRVLLVLFRFGGFQASTRGHIIVTLRRVLP